MRWKILWILACALGVGGFALHYLEVHDLDPRVLAVMATGLLMAALAFWGLAMRSETTGAVFLAASLGGGALIVWPGILPHLLDASQLRTAKLLAFSFAHLAGTVRCRRFSAGWWAAQTMGLANVLISGAGIAAPLAIILWTLQSSRTRQTTISTSVIVGNGLLIAVGIVRLATTATAASPWIDRSVLHHLFAWPFSGFILALITAAPSIYLLTQREAGEDSAGSHPALRLLGGWMLIQTVFVCSAPLRPTSSWPLPLFVFGLVIHFCSLAAVLAGKFRPGIKVLVGTLWIIGLLNLTIQQIDRTADLEPVAIAETAALPARTALPLTPSPNQPSGFSARAVPTLKGLPVSVPTWGNWSPTGSFTPARFVSEPIQSSAPLLSVFLAGSLHPPDTSLVLRTADGRESSPLLAEAETSERWKEFHFKNPGRAFQLVAEVKHPDRWLAFSAPIEVDRLHWLAGKLIALWPEFIGLALVLGFAGCTGCLRAWQRDRENPASHRTADGMRWIPWLALLAYIFFLANFVDTYAAGSDSAGYLNSAKLMLQGRFTYPARVIPGITINTAFYAPLGLNVVKDTIVPGYPPGLPLMLTAIGHWWSLDGAIPVIVLAHLLLGIVFTERLAAVSGLPRPWSFLPAGMIALCPLYVHMGLQSMSDAASLVWVTAAIYFALASRERASRALWAGLATGLAVLLRPANAIVLLPVLIAVGVSPKRLVLLGLGGLPGALFFAGYNYKLYGSPFQTAYGDVSSLFKSQWLAPTLHGYVVWITVYFTPLIWLAVGGVIGSALSRSAQAALAAVVAAYLGFYAFYEYTHETWWYLRFVLPAFPALAILSAAGVKRFVDWKRPESASHRSWVVLAALGALLVGNAIWRFSTFPILDQWHGDQVYWRSAKWIDAHTPANAVVLCFQTSGALAFYSEHPIIRAETTDTTALQPILNELLRLKTPVYAMVFQSDTTPHLELLPGRWIKSAELGFTTVWKMNPVR